MMEIHAKKTTEDYDVVMCEKLVEAIIFASSEPVTENEILKRLPENAQGHLSAILDGLKETYQSRGFQLVQREQAWCFRTDPALGEDLEIVKEIPRKLSRAAMETLAVIAYHQLVTRPEIENIRGVAVSKGTLDLLMDEGWIALGRRREVPGRPVTWKTTQHFLDCFGLERLKDLPGVDEMKSSGLLDSRAAIEIVGGEETIDLFDTNLDSSVKEDDDNDEEEMTL